MSYDYQEKLSKEAAERYQNKLDLIGLKKCLYKFASDEWKDDPTEWPALAYHHVYQFLIKSPRIYSSEAMENFKSLDAYKFFIDGWVQTIKHQKLSGGAYILHSEVRPSFRTTETPHQPWVAIENLGKVLAGHCDCMAGLGETCSHVAAVLFKIETANRIGMTHNVSTDLPCKWNQNFTKNINPSPVSKINLYSSKAKEKLNLSRKCYDVEVTHNDEMDFIKSLSTIKTRPVVLHLFPQYDGPFIEHKVFVPKQLPSSLREFYSPKYIDLTAEELNKICTEKKQSLTLSADQIFYIEEATRNQAQCEAWCQQRAGRLTGSLLSEIYKHAINDTTSSSLIKNICNPSSINLHAPPIKWGKENEKLAFLLYQSVNLDGVIGNQQISLTDISLHEVFQVKDVGFCIDSNMPWIGASPDGIVTCDCCGSGVLEIKCPYSLREKSLLTEIKSGSFYVFEDNNLYFLKKDHKYYFQVQLEIRVTLSQYCDFMIWTPTEFLVIRIKPEVDFIDEVLKKVTMFWEQEILPELLTQRIETTKLKKPNKKCSSPKKQTLYCICKRPYCLSDDMVACDDCDNWFHPSCIGLKKLPKKKAWYCKECRKKK
ncbi:uncharacterized protein LOC101237261 isoform X2 [Hydra vulgaris]